MTVLQPKNQDDMLSFETEFSKEYVDYEFAVEAMEKRVSDIVNNQAKELLWFLEHPPIYTSGTSTKPEDLLEPRFPVYKTGRGGELTYHGPGQRVVYVMLNLDKRGRKDIRRFVFDLEQWLINSLSEFGVLAERREGRVGLWVDMFKAGKGLRGQESKIAAIGVRVRRWVTYHGVAINLNPDLSHFGGIVPCGISEHGVTSLKALGVEASMEEVDAALKACFGEVFLSGV